MVLAGVSFGGGVAQHYTLRFPDHVERMVLLGSVGSPEPYWRPVPMLTRASVIMLRWVLFPFDMEVCIQPLIKSICCMCLVADKP